MHHCFVEQWCIPIFLDIFYVAQQCRKERPNSVQICFFIMYVVHRITRGSYVLPYQFVARTAVHRSIDDLDDVEDRCLMF